MEWFGKECLNPAYTRKLVKSWQAPPGTVQERYYNEFPQLRPNHLPLDHYMVKYNVSLYPLDRDYRTFKSAPKEIKSPHRIEWEDGYGPCQACELCKEAKKQNDEMQADYYRRLEAWRTNGTPM